MGWFDDTEDDALSLDWGGGDSSFDFGDALSLDWGDLDFGGAPDLGSALNFTDALDLDWGSNPLFDFPSLDALDLDWGNISDLGSLDFGLPSIPTNFVSDMFQGISDFGSNVYDSISNLFSGPSYADLEDMDAGRYLDEQYAADILEGIDRSDADAELFRQQAINAALDEQLTAADIQDRDAALYLDELYGKDTSGFSAADQAELDAEMYRQELLDQQTANRDVLEDIMSMADQEDIDREMYRKEQEELGIERQGAASGKFTDLSGGKGGTTNITKEELTKKTDDKKTDDTKTGTGGGKITDILKNKDNQLLMMLLGGLLGLLGNKGGGATPGYKGGIPTYTATRGTPVSPTAGGRRAGGAGLGSLTGGVTYTKAAQGGLMELADGGEIKTSAIDLPSWTPTSDISAKWTSTPDPSAGSFVTPGGKYLGYTPTTDELSRAQSLRDQYGFSSKHGGDAAMQDALNLARRQAAGTMSDEDVRNTALAYKYNYSPADVGKILARGGTEQDVQYNALARFYGDTPDTIERYGVNKDLPMKLAQDEAKRRGIPVEQIASNYVDLNYVNPDWTPPPPKNLVSYIETEDGLQQVVKENPEYAVYLLKKMLEKQQEAEQQGAGSSVLPQYTAERTPGAGVTYTRAAQGGLMDILAGQPNESVLMMAKGGETGRYLRGATDGMADKIYTDIDGQQPARLSHGEFVIPADVVSHLGNGNSDAGAKELHEMMNRVRKARTGTTKQGKEIKPRKHMAA